MSFLSGGWSERESPAQAAAAAAAVAVNASWPAAGGSVLSPQAQLLLEVLVVLMCLGAVTGNILVIVIVAATKTFHCVTSVLIMNLAVSDLLVGVGVMPFIALSIMNHGWVDCSSLCLYVGYTSSVYCTASVLTLAAIALDRYHSIMHCLHYNSRCTLWRTFTVVLWIWMQALATSCPPLLGWGSVSYVVPMYSCAVNWASSPGYTAFMSTLSYLVPAIIILFCYVNIVKVARGHARRIHTLEGSVQRNNLSSVGTPAHFSHQQCNNHRSPLQLIYHVSGQFVSEVSTEQGDSNDLPNPDMEQSNTSPRRLFSLLAQSISQPPVQNSQPNHHGVVRLFLVISAFFLCWTPYIGVSLVQATETAISGQSTLVPPFAVTFSYWLLLLNSDINPLLYALLSKRFQGALQSLRQKLRAQLGGTLGRKEELRAEEDDGSNSEPCTLTNTAPLSSSEIYDREDPKYCSCVFTVSADLKHHSNGHLCKVCHLENTSASCSMWQHPGGHKTVDCLQVPSRPLEGSRLPFSALTEERQATFFYGQITVRVEHDVC